MVAFVFVLAAWNVIIPYLMPITWYVHLFPASFILLTILLATLYIKIIIWLRFPSTLSLNTILFVRIYNYVLLST